MSEPAPAPTRPTATTSDYLAEPIRIGEPRAHGALTVFPLFAGEPRQPYISFAQGHAQGVVVKELDQGASVNDLLVHNPTDTPVLLFEGEEVLGAQQNRTFDVTALVPGGQRLQVPVSCVEAGRWDGRRAHESFSPSPQAANARLRGEKARQVRARLQTDASGPARANQSQVWSSIDAQATRLGVASQTRALHDVYEERRDRLHAHVEAIPPTEGQAGALAAIGERIVVLDWVSRPEVFASLYPALLQGYALDAIEAETLAPADPPSAEEAEAFLSHSTEARASERDGIGLGREVRFGEGALVGSGLAVDRELVQITVHNEDGDSSESTPGRPSAHRVRRPSRRRA